MSIGFTQKNGLFLLISTALLLIFLMLLNTNIPDTVLLAIIFYSFIIGLINNKLGLFLLIILRPCLGLFINQPIMTIGNFAPNAVSLIGGLTIIFAGFVILKHLEKSKKLPLLNFWAIFIGITIITLPLSVNPSDSLKEIIRLISIFSLFYASFLLIKSSKDLSFLIKAVVVSGLVPSLVALFQYFTGMNLSSPEEDVASRVFGTFSHPNLLAFYLMIPLTMCCLIFLVSDKKKVSILLYGIFSSIIAIALGLTYTRGAWIGFLIIVLALGISKYRWFLVIACAVLFISYFSSGTIQSRVGSVTRIDPYGSIQFRIDLWEDAIGLFWQNPIIGHGTDSATTLISRKRFDMGSVHPHNDYIKVALENGLIGLTAYLALMIGLFKKLFTLYKKENRPRLKTTLFVMLLLSVSIYIVSLGDNILKNTSLMWSFWALLGGILAIETMPRKKKI